MKKQSRQFVILIAALAFLAAAFFGLKQYNKVQDGKPEEDSAETTTLVDIDEEDIIRFSYKYNGESYTFEKEEDTWYYAEDPSMSMNQYSINVMVSKLAEVEAIDTLENVTDMAQYGLADPERTIQYETADASYTFWIGDYNSMTYVYYLRIPSETTVYTVSAQMVSIFTRTPEDMKEEEESTEEDADGSAEESADGSAEEGMDGSAEEGADGGAEEGTDGSAEEGTDRSAEEGIESSAETAS